MSGQPRVDIRVGADVQPLTDGVKKASRSLEMLGGTLSRYLGAAALAAAAQGVLNYAGALSDLSMRAGVTMEWLQAAGHAVKQGGASFEDLANGMGKLKSSMAGAAANQPKTVKAFRDLGISIDEIKKQSPELVFERIAAALEKAGGSAQSVKAAIAILGPGAKRLLPGMLEDFKGSMDDARKSGIVADDKDILAADQFGDLIGTLTTQAKAKALSLFRPSMQFLGKLGVGTRATLRGIGDAVAGPVVRGFQNQDPAGALMEYWTGKNISGAYNRSSSWASGQNQMLDEKWAKFDAALAKQAAFRTKLAQMSGIDEDLEPDPTSTKSNPKFDGQMRTGMSTVGAPPRIQRVQDNDALSELRAIRQQLQRPPAEPRATMPSW